MEEDSGPSWSKKCRCGKSFYKPNSYSNHVRSCLTYKNDAGATLHQAKMRYAQKRKGKKGRGAIESWYGEGEGGLDIDEDIVRRGVDAPAPEVVDPQGGDPEPMPMGRGMRVRAPTKAYHDFVTTSSIPLDIPMFGRVVITPPQSPSPDPISSDHERRLTILEPSHWKASRQNGFRVSKTYWTTETRPHDPDLYLSNFDFREDEDDRVATVTQTRISGAGAPNAFHPFPNWSSYKLGEWFWSDGGDKTRESFQHLLDIICSEDFSPADLRHNSWKRIDAALASSEFEEAFDHDESQWADDGTSWKTSSVTVRVPFNSASKEPGPKPFTIADYRFRPLAPLIRAKLQDPGASEHFHYVPSELWWESPCGGGKLRVHGDLYHSDAFLDAYREVQLLPPENDEDGLPRCVVALMFFSDETMLASFGDAKLWPVYLAFGNESKYRRSRTSLRLLEEIAYFQGLPDSFADWYTEQSGKNTVGRDLLTHVKRELFHAQWHALLDDEFVHAYEHGLVVDCPDGVRRRFYPRILTYSADYPERTRVVGVRTIGRCPCPRCLVPLDRIHLLGSASDIEIRNTQQRMDDSARRHAVQEARSYIYEKNYAVDADKVEKLLKPTSIVPAQNAFSERLSPLGFDMHNMLAVDILHEVEIGAWKSLFIHLLRLLEAVGAGMTNILDARFRQIPSFGRDIIRRFSRSVSAMKQLGARDFEDILQCALAAFEGLFPDDHDNRVQDLLYAMAQWHALTKLRMHTDLSLSLLDKWTTIMGDLCRTFVELTCNDFDTKELKREYEARKRREARKTKVKSASAKQKEAVSSASPTATLSSGLTGDATNFEGPAEDPEPTRHASGRRPQSWSISTPKFHSLGDVVAFIRRCGTTDSYSTQLSERVHRFPKARYRRTNKKDVSRQLSRIQTRQARIKKLRKQLQPSGEEVDLAHPWALPNSGDPRYFIGKSQNQPVNIHHFLRLNADDPATQDFLIKLKRHLFTRIMTCLIEEVRSNEDSYPEAALDNLLAAASSGPSERDLDNIFFHSDTIFRHNVMKIPYTTYDCRQDSDTLNPHTPRRDFMCLPAHASSQDGPQLTESTDYVYGRILGIFHANIIYGGTGAIDSRRRRFDFIWARSYTTLPRDDDGTTSYRLDRVKLVPIAQAESWGFVDPADVLRAVHIIPRFARGKVHGAITVTDAVASDRGKRTAKPIFSKCARDEHDWQEYYINRFVDRDMLMRFFPGLAVGHLHNSGAPPSPNLSSQQEEPMDIDIPPVMEVDQPPHRPFRDGSRSDSEGSSLYSEVEKDWERDLEDNTDGEGSSSSAAATEPDSEEYPDFYA